jgi:hypothetical protein
MSDAKRIKELLRRRVEELAQYLFPNGHREGAHWCVGSIEGEPGKSFKICIAGEKAWWGDFAGSGKHSRNLLDLWMCARKVDFKTALHQAAEWLGQPLSRVPQSIPKFPTLNNAIGFAARKLKMLVTRRDMYHDRNGNEHFVVVRFDSNKGKEFRPFWRSESGWVMSDPPGQLPLFRLPELIAQDPREADRSNEVVFIVEGEKCVCELATLGLRVTTSAHGANSANKTDWQLLAGRKVVILPDNDAEGRTYAQNVLGILNRLSPPAVVRIVELPGLPLKGDCVDWLERRDAQIPEHIVEELLAIVENAEVIREAENGKRGSLNSQSLPFELRDDYPEPLALAAFHGLAGEIVRRIEPHTEADPAALLFQFLTAFGNLIGHDHYIVADGTRHYLILYCVLVGQTSKGRKGTSWNHIANLMERVEPEWRQDRISYGLSSGEGLIWTVRDPIEETKPVRAKGRFIGEYETYIANHGEDDKRLLVIEAEFANVLKVMAREGNTLSPVIRCAWDSGDLRTMVKNSPARATKAHISIVGHITRDELRRLLTQTESANGFANRYCWLAVKRSKCLPDGGAIHTVGFDDVVAQLQSAVDFAKDFVEIFRDPEAKKLWREAYPGLSEGKPGMLGAITGRAEAQVMRLSAIYALLDKSRLIRPDHHGAAMALWKYCEESCRWIFGTSTGDRNADKILAALRHAPKGMTKTEISAEVFNRHASSSDIDEALRLLHGLRMAYYRPETTGGAPLQRWFFVAETCEKSE